MNRLLLTVHDVVTYLYEEMFSSNFLKTVSILLVAFIICATTTGFINFEAHAVEQLLFKQSASADVYSMFVQDQKDGTFFPYGHMVGHDDFICPDDLPVNVVQITLHYSPEVSYYIGSEPAQFPLKVFMPVVVPPHILS